MSNGQTAILWSAIRLGRPAVDVGVTLKKEAAGTSILTKILHLHFVLLFLF